MKLVLLDESYSLLNGFCPALFLSLLRLKTSKELVFFSQKERNAGDEARDGDVLYGEGGQRPLRCDRDAEGSIRVFFSR